MTDYLYRGPIDTRYRPFPQRIAYFCECCARVIEIPTGTEFCGACLQAQKGTV